LETFKSAILPLLELRTDIAKALGYENPAKAIATHCKLSDITNRYVAHQNGIGIG